MRGRGVAPLLGAVVGIALLCLIVARVGLDQLAAAFTALHPGFVAAALLVLLANMALRAQRWRLLFTGVRPPRYAAVFSALMVSYLANNVLPARAGDLLRAYLLGNDEGVSRSEVLGTVLVERVLDLLTACLMLGIAMCAVPAMALLARGGLLMGAGALAGFAMLLLLQRGGSEAIDRVLDLVRVVPPGWRRRLRRLALGFQGGVAAIGAPRRSLAFIAATVLIWGSEIAIVLLFARAFALPIGPVEGWLLILLAAFGAFIPALPGQVGSFEVAVVFGMEALGFGGAASVAFVLSWHLTLLAATSALGGICLALGGRSLVPLARAAEAAEGSVAAGGVGR